MGLQWVGHNWACIHTHTHTHTHTHSFGYSFTNCLTLRTVNHVLILYFFLLKYRILYSAVCIPSLHAMWPLPISLCLWFVSVLLHLFSCSLASINKWNHDIFFIWFISFSIIPSRPINIVTNVKILHFYGWVMFHCIYMPLILYIFIF